MAKILSVDDDAHVRELLHAVIQRKGHQVVSADNGQHGIQVFRREQPDITILDMDMPDMNGISVLKAIRSVDPQAAVIVLTGTGTHVLEKQAADLGVRHFLAKGFSLHELGAAIDQVMKERGLSVPVAPQLRWKMKARQ
ncbi:Response regulator [Nitrospira tepida]|uniref:Response regulator n=1 Tax=Nitrospira tepida TaxID=2973512 RepID=A0AA86T7B5_9BACT|nr:response regulator [Nitrospira tepida]CAI4032942.1 Response regulator [Nitrospira tepida]